MVMLVGGCATTSPKQSNGTDYPNFVPASSPFGFGGPDKQGNVHDTGWFIKFLSLMSGQGIPNTQQSGGNSQNSSSDNMIHKQANLASDGRYVSGNQQQAPAGCVWQWDCSTSPCRQVPLCSSAIDIVPPRPPSIAPIPTPTIKPIPTPYVAPVGTTQCNQRYICNENGCGWKNVCQ